MFKKKLWCDIKNDLSIELLEHPIYNSFIAKDIFENQRPDFPYVKNLIDLDHAATSDIKDGDIFSETYDNLYYYKILDFF